MSRECWILLLACVLVLPAGCGERAALGPSPELYGRVRAAAEERFEAGAVTASLERIRAWLAANAPQAADVLQPGLTDAQIDAKVKAAGFSYQLPAEVRELYRWRDGSRPPTDVPFVSGHRLLSLDEALAAAMGAEMRDLFRTPPGAFPILAFQEEYFYVICETEARKALPVLFRLLEDPTAVLSYTSCAALFATWADAQAENGIELDSEVAVQQPRAETWRKIKARHNPELAPR